MIPNVIIPVLNRYDLLQRLLDSIDFPIGDLLIIDNGGQVQELRFPDFVLNSHILPLPSNLGVSASWNLGIKLFPHHHKWLFASNDAWFGSGALERLCDARRDEIVLSGDFPFWHVFSVGDEALSRFGLFDEALTPAYFEDRDAERRAKHFGVPIRKLSVPIGHDNSSTINSDNRLKQLNAETFMRNQDYYHDKVAREDYGPGGWDLGRRRLNSWDE